MKIKTIKSYLSANSIVLSLFLSSLVLFPCCRSGDHSSPNGAETGNEDFPLDSNIYEYGIPINLYEVEEGIVKQGDYFSSILNGKGVSQKRVYDISQLSQSVFDVKGIQIGKSYHAYYKVSDTARDLEYLVYEKDNLTKVLFKISDTMSVKIIDKEVVTELKYVDVSIEHSLWQDTQDAGCTPLLALKLSDIYAWSIDFFALQKGDSFKALYEEVSCEGAVMDVNNILFASFVHSGKEYLCYYFDEGDEDGNRYWTENGESMRKAFLKAPLKFSRISSGFSYARRHPITRIVRPHTGVDYAAPKGTPVMSIGDGTVISKGYAGGGGNTVKIRHNSVYTTAYLHLSKYGPGISKGSHVSQGQIIGYVGSTGSSTGPHLDFRVWKNGSPINPLKMESPPADPVKKDNMEMFVAWKQKTESQRDSVLLEEHFQKAVIAPLSGHFATPADSTGR